MFMIAIRKTEVFVKWLDGLNDIRARARILVRIERLAAGNPGDVKPVGGGVSELRINYGPGYRVYYKQQGEKVAITLRFLGVYGSAQNSKLSVSLCLALLRQVIRQLCLNKIRENEYPVHFLFKINKLNLS